jgi:SAM-dependent methyltransferase
MCPPSAARFVACHLAPSDVTHRRVLEVGSHDPKGVVRSIVEPLRPREYIGVDLVTGSGVDILCSAERLLDRFGPGSFDVVVCTEVLEHVQDWRLVAHNLKAVLRGEGVLVATTRSRGFEFHGYPLDFWRYQANDISAIFGDLYIEAIEDDPDDPPGIFFRARRVSPFEERDLSSYRLYSVVRRRAADSITSFDVATARCLSVGKTLIEQLLTQAMRDALRRAIHRAAGRPRPVANCSSLPRGPRRSRRVQRPGR